MANRRRRGPIVNRRHMARQQRERLFSQYITIGSIVLIAIVVILIGYGFIVARVVQPRQPVAIVNGEEILTREFQAQVRYERSLLVSQWVNLANLMTDFGVTDASSQNFFIQQLQQIEFSLDASTVGRTVLNNQISDRLIRQEAARRGITVSEEEITKSLEENFGFFGGGPRPSPTAVPTRPATSTLSPLQMTLTAPTATPSPTITETVAITSTETTTGTQAIEMTPTAAVTDTVESQPEDVPTPTPFPTSTPYTREAFEADLAENLDTLERLGYSEADLRRLVESDLYRQKLLEAVTAEVSQIQDHAWARQILVGTEAEAQDVIARLEGGENFAILAQEVSLDQNTAIDGGDLGWFTREQFPEIADAAFSLEIGGISEPIQSQFGFHVIQVLGREERSLTTSEFDELKQSVFETWITDLRQDSDIEIFDYWANRVPTEPNVPAGGVAALIQQLQQQQPAVNP